MSSFIDQPLKGSRKKQLQLKGDEMAQYTIIATAAMGLEALVAKEVRALGYECTVDNGKVIF